ncbi:hypothetical protein niasHS_001610 [Heterodera schachtii]|uniref:Uncharacterized protein n=1 Tax=Heterodera schachtii TaxID=97005 RepID=A0ABD2KDX7_HETSC
MLFLRPPLLNQKQNELQNSVAYSVTNRSSTFLPFIHLHKCTAAATQQTDKRTNGRRKLGETADGRRIHRGAPLGAFFRQLANRSNNKQQIIN